MDALESLPQTPVIYDSYLLRTWRTAAGGNAHWMIENVMTGDRHTFTNLPDLVIFLRDHSGKMSADRSSCRQPRHRSPYMPALPKMTADSAEE